MSRIVDEWRGKNDNTPIPPRVRVRVFERDEKRCRLCSTPIHGGRWQCDHTIALINGGENRESNLRCICAGCHKIKTASDVAEKSKVYRIKAKAAGVSLRKGRPFPGGKNSKTKRKVSGQVVDRATGLPVTFGRTQ